ncbi:1434_t:CDS:1, partial [Entrophospora sp. SA101]
MDSNQRNLSLVEKDIELMGGVSYNLVEKEKGSESEYDEDDDSRMFVLDESALETAKNLFDFQRCQDVQDGE